MNTKNITSQLLKSEIFSSMPGMVGVATLEGVIIAFSPDWGRVLGFPSEEFIGKSVFDFVHPDDLLQTREATALAVKGEDIQGFVSRYRCSDGSYTPINMLGRLGEDGLIYIQAADVTERLEVDDDLKRSNIRLKHITEIAGIGGWEVNVKKQVLTWDDQTRTIHEVESDFEPDLETAINFYAPEARDMVADAVARGMEHGEPWDFEAPLITAKNNRIWVNGSGRVEFENGEPVRITGIFRDITETKMHSLMLEQARKRAEDMQALAEQANQAKTNFLANMSHEIRTPLNGVLGMTQLLQRLELDDSAKLYLDTLEQSGRALQLLIDDILDISRIEAGQIALDEDYFDLNHVVKTVYGVVASEAAQKNLDLISIVQPEITTWRLGDEKRFGQVLLNLVSNAVKFTHSGSITTTLCEECEGVIKVNVEDTGPGVPDAMQSVIFDRFAQVDASARRAHDGAGLGLAICKELVDLAGGSIGLVSNSPKGSCFWFEWPLPVSKGASRPDRELSTDMSQVGSNPTGKILIAEDKSVNYMVLYEAFKAIGFEILHAKTGIEAIQFNTQHKPDVILMDIHMPQMTGDEAIAHIHNEQGHIPTIFAVTADATPKTRARVEALGVQGIFIKPYDLDDIIEKTQKAVSLAHAL